MKVFPKQANTRAALPAQKESSRLPSAGIELVPLRARGGTTPTGVTTTKSDVFSRAKTRPRSLSLGALSPLTEKALTPPRASRTPKLTLVGQPALPQDVVLASDIQMRGWRLQLTTIEKEVDKAMGPWARRGFARMTEIGRGVALTVGAVAGMLTFVVGPHHLVLAVGISSIVYAGMVLAGLLVELVSKRWTYSRVRSVVRDDLRALCETLNERELQIGSARSLEEKALCHEANTLWTEITFNGRTIGRTLASAFADWRFDPLKPQRKETKVVAAAPREPLTLDASR